MSITYRRVNFRWKRNLDLILVSVHTDAHSFFNICRRHSISESHHELGYLFNVDHVLRVVRVGSDYFRASSNLQRLLLLHHLLITHEVPHRRRSEAGITLLDTCTSQSNTHTHTHIYIHTNTHTVRISFKHHHADASSHSRQSVHRSSQKKKKKKKKQNTESPSSL